MTKLKKTVLVILGIIIVPLFICTLSTYIGPSLYGGEKPRTPEEAERMDGDSAFSFIKDTFDTTVIPAAEKAKEFVEKSLENPLEVFEDAFE